MADRWASYDCYGTLVDWRGGIGAELGRLFGEERRDALLERYYVLEPEVQRDGSLRYREVLARTLALVAGEIGELVPDGEEDALSRSLPRWPVFPEVPAALEEARARGWRLAILSNTDPELIDQSLAAIGVPVDLVVAASAIGSYKPALGHWRAFVEQIGSPTDVHVGASLFHDVEPAIELGLPSIWVNRLGEPATVQPTRELRDLSPLADTLDALVPA